MATIPSANNQLRHVRKTVTFTGGAGAGELGGNVATFTLTGRVWAYFVVYCSSSLVCTAGGVTSITLGVTGGTSRLLGFNSFTVSGITTGSFLDASEGSPRTVAAANDSRGWAFATDPLIYVVDGGGGANVTGGTLIIDAFYYPITDDGALAGDDIDAGYTPADVKAWLGTAAATPTVAGVPEVDVTHNAGTAITAAAGIQEVKVASIAAAAITAAAIATNAIDADALASDAVDEIWAKAMSDLAAVPGATASVLAAINWMFELARNKRTQTATTETVYKDDETTALATSTKTDGGTTFTLGEYS